MLLRFEAVCIECQTSHFLIPVNIRTLGEARAKCRRGDDIGQSSALPMRVSDRSINQHELAMAPHIQSSARCIAVFQNQSTRGRVENRLLWTPLWAEWTESVVRMPDLKLSYGCTFYGAPISRLED